MRITLNQEEIEEAIEKLILDQVDVPDDMRIDIDLKATRGDEGYTAEIDILPYDAPTDGTARSVDPRINVVDGAEGMSIADKTEEAITEAAKPRRRGRPAGAKNKPKPHRREPESPEAEEPEVKDNDGGTNGDVDQSPDTEPDVQNDPEPQSEPGTEPDAEPDTDNPEDTSAELAESAESAESSGTSEEDAGALPEAEPDNRPIEDVEAEAGEAPVTTQEQLEERPAQEPVEETETETPPSKPTRSLFANVQRRDGTN